MNLYFGLEAPHWWVLEKDGEIEGHGEAATLSQIPDSQVSGKRIGVAPGELVAVHRVRIPARSRAKMQAAVPYALEEQLAEEVERLHFVVLQWSAGEDAVVAVISKQLLSDWLDACREAELSVDRMVADYSLLPMHPATDYTIAMQPDARVLVRAGDGSGFVLDRELVIDWLDGLQADEPSLAINDKEMVRSLIENDNPVDARYWEIGDRPANWLTHQPDTGVNLLSGEFQPRSARTPFSSYRWVAYCLLAAVLIKLAADAYLFISLSLENRRLDAELRQTISEHFPGIKNIIPSRERFIVQQEIDRLKGGGGARGDFMPLLASIAGASRGQNISVEDLTYRNGKLTVSCSLRDFNAVDQLSKKFDENPSVMSRLESSSANEGRVTGRFVLSVPQ